MYGFAGRVFFTLFLACYALFPALAAESDNKKVLIIAADEWCPINCAQDSKQPGIGIDMARQAFEPMGYRIDYRIMPWSEALKQVREGKIHAVVGASRKDDNTLIFPDSAITFIKDSFYVRAGTSWRYQGIYTLKNKRLGIIKDYGYGEVVTAFIKQNQFTPGILHEVSGKTPLEDNVKNLLDGKIDILVESGIVMNYMLKKQQLTDKIIQAGSVPQDSVYLAFSPALPASKTLASHYDAAIRGLRKTGMLAKMYEAYALTPEK